MNVLILHQHFKVPAGGGAIRSYYLAKALADRGHRVVVVTGHNAAYRQEDVEGITVHWLPVAYDNRFGFVARSFSFLKYNWAVIRRPRLFSGVHVCYAISVPLTIGLVAMWIKRWYKIPYLFEVGDLWPEAPVQLGFIRHPVLRNLLYRLEKKIYRKARSVVALSVAIKHAVEQKVPGCKVHLLPNMSDTCFYHPAAKDAALETRFGVERRFVVSYMGAAGIANGLEYFLACAKTARQSKLPLRFILCGDGATWHGLKHTAEAQGLDNVLFVPFQNREGVRQVMNVSDAVFVCYKPVPVLETGSPNKYFDGLAAGKLIVINFGGWIREEIEKNACGIYVDPAQPGDFVQQLTPFLYDRDMLASYQQSARWVAETYYSRTMLAQKFADIVTADS